jgi:hypothetical protein
MTCRRKKILFNKRVLEAVVPHLSDDACSIPIIPVQPNDHIATSTHRRLLREEAGIPPLEDTGAASAPPACARYDAEETALDGREVSCAYDGHVAFLGKARRFLGAPAP